MKKEQIKDEVKKQESLPKRQIIIETDGSTISVIKNETAGSLELAAVLQTLLAKLTQQR